MTRSVEVGKACCKRPAIATMDYVKHSPANWNCGEPRINRVCTTCWTHWFGEPNEVKQFTRAEWDRLLEAA